MKIELEEPYKSRWKKGYLVTNPEQRKTVILYNNSKDRSSVSYARYLMSCSQSRFLEREEQVDHINNIKTEDHLDNLQILSPIENVRKSLLGQTLLDFICPVCKKHFQLTARQSHKINPTWHKI
jgi:transcription initiation factor IIE alpha subunit